MLREEERRKAETDESGHIIHTSKNIQARVIREDGLSRIYSRHFTLDELRKEIDRDCKTPIDALITQREQKKLPPHPSEVEGSSDTPEESDLEVEKASEECWSGAHELKYVKPETGAKRRTRNQKRPPTAPSVGESVDIYKEFDYLNKETGVVDQKLPHNFAENKMDHVRLQINIPRNVWQKDKLYRIKDCFYDDQGVFLYRVPGLF